MAATTDLAAPTGERLLTISDVAERWRVQRTRVWDMARNDPDFPPLYRLGGPGSRTVRVALADVEAYERRAREGA